MITSTSPSPFAAIPRLGFLSALIALFCFATPPAKAQGDQRSGSIAGVVGNAATGSVLNEARVEIQALRRIVFTDETGRFLIPNLAPGEYDVTISYIGLDTHTRKVRVIAGETTEIPVDLTSDVYLLEQFVVTGEREGNAASMTRQRTSENLKNVVSMDALGALANENPGELLMRLPGVVGVIDDEGNVAQVSVRGAPVGMTNFSIDGNQQASTGGLNREYRTHGISAALFDELEVIKAPTPDMPGDSLGGSVNLKTASTLRFKGRRISYCMTGRWAPPFYDHTPMREARPLHGMVNLGYRDIFSVFGGRNNLGISVNFFYNENVSGFDRRQMDYEYTLNSPAYLWDYRQIEAYNNRKQMNGTLRLDFRPVRSSTFYFTLLYNDAFEPHNRRYQTRMYSATSVAEWNESTGSWGGGIILPTYTDDITEMRGGTTNTRIISTSNLYSFLARERTFTFGGKHEWNRFNLEYDANYNYSHSNLGDGHNTRPGGTVSIGTRMQGWIFDRTESRSNPVFIQTSGTDAYAPESYNSDAVTLITRDGGKRNTDIYNARADLRYLLPTAFTSSLKSGVAWRSHEVDVINRDRRYRYSAALGGNPARFVDPSIETNFGRQSGQEIPKVNTADVAADMVYNPDFWSEDVNYAPMRYYLNTKNIKEDVSAVYIQGNARISRLTVLGGVRFERTKVDGFGYVPLGADTSGNITNPEEYYGNAVNNSGSYDHWFPGVHLVYEITPNIQGRVSWSNSVGRPSLNDLTPGLQYNTIEDSDLTIDRITVNNPGLGPQTSENWDISLECYFEPVGQFSVGVFRKNLKDFLVSADLGTMQDIENSRIAAILETYPWLARANYSDHRLRTTFNGGKARVDGLELSYQQQLRFLPGIFKNTRVFANYTRQKATGDYGDESGNSTDEMARFVPESANAGLTVKYKNFECRANVNYTGKQLWTWAEDRYRLLYRASRTTVNFYFSYRLHKSATISCQIHNAFNAPNRFHYHTPDRVQAYTLNGTTMTLSISGDF